jgi:hypothetical protein
MKGVTSVGDALVAIRFVIRTSEILFKTGFSAKLIKNSATRRKGWVVCS